MDIYKEIGKRIREERKARGLTLENLARRAGYTNYQTLLNIENGRKRLTLSDLFKISNALGVQIEYFLKKTFHSEAVFVWRDRKDNEEEKCKIFENKLLEYMENYIIVLKLVNKKYPKYEVPEKVNDIYYKNKKYDFAEKLAEWVRSENYLGIGEYPGQELLQSILDKGIIVFKIDFKEIGSAVSTVNNNMAGMLVNKDNAPWRFTYDIAHELFHLLTWNIFKYQEIYNNKQDHSLIESLANAFAANLLIPKEKIEEKIDIYNKIDKDFIVAESINFKVSIDAMCNRLVFLKKLSKKEAEKYKNDTLVKNEFYKLFLWKYGKYDSYFFKDTGFPFDYFFNAFRALKESKLSKMMFAKMLDKNIGEIDYWFLKTGIKNEWESI